MPDTKKIFNDLISIQSLESYNSRKSLDILGSLIDLSMDFRSRSGLIHAIKLSKQLSNRDLKSPESAELNYFLGNAWSNLGSLRRRLNNNIWEWEQAETEKEIIHYRKALQLSKQDKASEKRLCQILINLGNLMSNVGRFVEAVDYWERALALFPNYSMALGNRGYGRKNYADYLYDRGHALIFYKHAYTDLVAVNKEEIHESAWIVFDSCRQGIENNAPSNVAEMDFDLYKFSIGRSKKEKNYRQWCLQNRLFLNPLNDLGLFPIAARDVLHTPNITADIEEGPIYQGFYNQMKQEFVSARFQYYEGVNTESPHFSDKEVLLLNTLDYPSYSLSIEMVKSSFRTLYSIFDKIAFFLNNYLKLEIPPDKVAFRTFWYENHSKKNGIRKKFIKYENWPLRGLFWLSKDLYENKGGFRESLEPDAQKLNEIRNHLEHRYLKLHDDLWSLISPEFKRATGGISDTLAYSVMREDFELKTLKLLKLVRATLIYLSLGIHREEYIRNKNRGEDQIVAPMFIDKIEDDWKI